MAEHYDPNDINAVLSRIVTNQENKAIVDAERWQKMAQWMAAHQADCRKKGERIDSLENWRWYVLGIAAGVGIVLRFLFK